MVVNTNNIDTSNINDFLTVAYNNREHIYAVDVLYMYL